MCVVVMPNYLYSASLIKSTDQVFEKRASVLRVLEAAKAMGWCAAPLWWIGGRRSSVRVLG